MNMRKKIKSGIALNLTLAIFLIIIVIISSINVNGAIPQVWDIGNILSTNDESNLMTKLKEIEVDTKIRFNLVTTNIVKKEEIQEYADKLYENNLKHLKNNVLIIISIEDNSVGVASGKDIDKNTIIGVNKEMKPFLDNKNAVDGFLKGINIYIELNDKPNIQLLIVIGMATFGVGLIVVFLNLKNTKSLKGKKKNKK